MVVAPRRWRTSPLLLVVACGCGPSLGESPLETGDGSSTTGTSEQGEHDGLLDDTGSDSNSGSDSSSTSDSTGSTSGSDGCGPDAPPAEAVEGPAPTCTPTGNPYLYFTTWTDQRVYAFDPDTGAIDYDSELACARCTPTTGIAASTVDGDGNLWLYYSGDGIYIVDPTLMLCPPAALDRDDGLPFIRSLGFIPSAQGGLVYATAARDELGAADHVLTIDPTTLSMTPMGPIEESLSFRALAGREGPHLLGLLDFFEDAPRAPLTGQLIEIDPSDGQTIGTLFSLDPTPGVSIPSALAWWNDELFTIGLYDGAGGSILRLDLDTSTQSIVLEDIRAAAGNAAISTFTGAGASACR